MCHRNLLKVKDAFDISILYGEYSEFVTLGHPSWVPAHVLVWFKPRRTLSLHGGFRTPKIKALSESNLWGNSTPYADDMQKWLQRWTVHCCTLLIDMTNVNISLEKKKMTRVEINQFVLSWYLVAHNTEQDVTSS